MSVAETLKTLKGASPPRAPLSLMLALRELRGGLKGFYIFAACIALGVASIAAVNSLSRALTNSIAAHGQTLLGGDIEFTLNHRQVTSKERSFLLQQGKLSEIATLRAMARSLDGRAHALIGLKAVDMSYPLYGSIGVEGEKSFGDLVHKSGQAVVDPLLLERLEVKPGNKIKIGLHEIVIAGVLREEPDRLSGRTTFGPRVIVSLDTLRQTGLAQPGSLVRWRYRIGLKDRGLASAAKLKSIRGEVKEKFPESGFTIQDRTNPAPFVKRAISRLSQFLTLVGLTALLVGGVGVANAVATYLDRKRKVIAIFKCLGASSKVVFQVYLLQVMIVAALGVIAGLIIGSVAPLIFSGLYGNILPFQLAYAVHPGALFIAALYGFLVALIFVLWPLGRAQSVKPQVLMRDEISEDRHVPPLAYIAVSCGLGLVLGLIAIFSADARMIALYFCLGLLFLFAVFLFYGEGIQFVSKRLPRPKWTELALAIADLSGPAALTRSVVLSLGTGLSLLVAIALVNHSLVKELRSGVPENAPSYYYLDITKDQYEAFSGLLASAVPEGRVMQAPMLRGRIISMAGRLAETIKGPPNVQWVLSGDRGLTYSDSVPEGFELTEGKWWPKAYSGQPLVSFEADIAHGFGLKIGDTVTINVLGRNIVAKIANFREVNWESLSINFVMIFSPNTFEGAPFNILATLNMPDGKPIPGEGRLIGKISTQFPNITSIRVRDTIEAVNSIFAKLMIAIRSAGSVTLIAGSLVLAGALATAERRRIYGSVILKTLGATRRRIITIHMLEYLMLALSVSVLAIILGSITAWIVVTQFMDLSFNFSLLSVLQAVIVAVALVLAFGIAGSWRALGAKIVPYLRAK